MRAKVEDLAALELLLGLFFGYERPEINQFHKAVEQFKSAWDARTLHHPSISSISGSTRPGRNSRIVD